MSMAGLHAAHSTKYVEQLLASTGVAHSSNPNTHTYLHAVVLAAIGFV